MKTWFPASLLLALSGALAACSGASDPAADGARAHELTLAVEQDRRFAAWHGGEGEGSAIHVQALDSSGQPTGESFVASDGAALAYEPDLILVGDRLVVAWYQRDRANGRLSAHLAAFSTHGVRQWEAALGDAAGNARNPVVRAIGDRIHVAWIAHARDAAGEGKTAVRYRQFSADGRAAGATVTVGEADRDTWNLNAATTDENFLIVFDAGRADNTNELHLVAVGPTGTVERQLTPGDGFASLYPDLQIGPDGRAAITWFDERDGNREVYLAVAPLDALIREGITAPRRVTETEGESIGAYLAWNGSRLLLAWSDEVAGRRDIFAQAFDPQGRPDGPARNISDSADNSSIPAVRAMGGGFLVAWNDYRLATGGDGHGAVQSSVARFAVLPGVGD